MSYPVHKYPFCDWNMYGVFCVDYTHFIPHERFGLPPLCSKYGWDMSMREGSIMTGCNRGERKVSSSVNK